MKSQTICGKTSFATEVDADYYIDKLSKTSKRKDIPIRAYLCPKCCNWHLTKKQEVKDKETQELLSQIKTLKRELLICSRANNKSNEKINNLKLEASKHSSIVDKLRGELIDYKGRYMRLVKENLDKNK